MKKEAEDREESFGRSGKTSGKVWDPYAAPDSGGRTEETVASDLRDNMEYHKRNRNSTLLIVLVLFVVLMAYSLTTGSGAVSMQIDEEAIGVAGPNGTTTILKYEDIVDVAYYEDFEVGQALDAYDSADNYEGTYVNDLLGEYSIIAYQKCSSMIVITTDTQIFAFNNSSASATGEDYTSLVEAIEALREE